MRTFAFSRGTASRATFSRVTVSLVAVATLTTACGPSQVSLDSRPSDEDSGRDLAFSVAEQARCGELEDMEVNSTNRWAFTCSASGHTFQIEVFSDVAGRDAATRRLRDARAPFRAGSFFVVSSDGDTSAAVRNTLAVFPGDIAG